jgi:hypothetical protein
MTATRIFSLAPTLRSDLVSAASEVWGTPEAKAAEAAIMDCSTKPLRVILIE